MAITPGTDVTIQDEPLPRGPIVEPSGGISRQFFNWFQGKDRKLGEIISGVNLNRQNIVQLEVDYQAADGTLSNAYIAADAVVFANSEASNAALSTTLTAAYQSADTALQGQITTNAGNITTAQADITTLFSTTATNGSAISTLQTNLSAEVTNRTNADTALQGQITTNAGNITTNSANITTLQSASATNTSAIATLQTNLSAETTNRTNADTNLQGQITTNAGAISVAQADITTLQSASTTNTSAIATLQTNLSAEVTSRTNADTNLQGQITTNSGNISTNSANITTLQSTTATNTSAISTLTTNLSAEVTNRTNADTNLQGQITTNAGNISTNTAAISTEATARASGDAANATSITNLNARIVTSGGLFATRPASLSDYTGAATGAPETVADLSSVTVVNVTGEGDVIESTIARFIRSKAGLPVIPGHTYRVTVRTACTVDGTNNQLQVGFRSLNADWSAQTVHTTVAENPHTVSDGWQTYTYERTTAQILATDPDAAYVASRVAICINAGGTTSGATVQVALIQLEDITDAATNAADITTLQSTTATNTSAIATLTTNLSAEVTNRTNADTSLQGQITTNAGNISTNAAAITTEATARASGDAANATSITNLTASVDKLAVASGPINVADTEYFTASRPGDPLTVADVTSYSATVVNDSDIGRALRVAWTTTGQNVLTKQIFEIDTNKTYKVRIVFRVSTLPTDGTANLSIIVAGLISSSSFTNPASTFAPTYSITTTNRQVAEFTISSAASSATNATYPGSGSTHFRVGLRQNAVENTTVDIATIEVFDATDAVANAAAITTEASARASGDAANATNIATVRAMVGADGSPIPDWDYRDSSFWNLPSGVIFAEGNPFTGVIRSIAMPDGTYDFSSDGWRVEPGATYEIVFRWWNGFGTFSGYVRPALHIPGVMWQSLRSGSAISNISSATGDQTGDIIAGSSSGTDVYRYTIPSSVTQIQTRLKASFSGNVNFYWALEMKKLPQFAEVTNIAEAYATNDSATARLVWKVDTSTNAATIEQTAATGYSDGTWNGSAIKLSANLIELLAEDINFGTNTTYEDTYATLYTEKNSKRLRILGPFPAADDLVLWFGPTTVSLNSETKTNGHFCLATDGKIYLGSAELTNSGNLDFTYTNGFVKTRIGNGTVTTDSVSFTGTGGSGSGYTFAHELIVTYTTGPTVTLSNSTGSPITASATGIVSDEVRFFVQTTMTDSAGNKVTKSKGGGLFWDI